jgi:hypothetical protein
MILGPRKVVPDGTSVAFDLAAIFGAQWGRSGEVLFILAGCTALFSTLIGQLAGWPRLLSDGSRICIPKFGQIEWKTQFRLFLVALLAINFIITFALGGGPVKLIQSAAFIEGVLLLPLQAIGGLVAIFFVLPKLLSEEAHRILQPSKIFAVALTIGAIVYFAVIIARFTL